VPIGRARRRRWWRCRRSDTPPALRVAVDLAELLRWQALRGLRCWRWMPPGAVIYLDGSDLGAVDIAPASGARPPGRPVVRDDALLAQARGILAADPAVGPYAAAAAVARRCDTPSPRSLAARLARKLKNDAQK
jgi:hypothetical protein